MSQFVCVLFALLACRDDVCHGETVLGRHGGRIQHTTTEAQRRHTHTHNRLVGIQLAMFRDDREGNKVMGIMVTKDGTWW